MGRLIQIICALVVAAIFGGAPAWAETSACKTLDAAQPWNRPAPAETHPRSAEFSPFLWQYGSDRPGNINMLQSYAVYVAEPNETVYRVHSRRGELNGATVPFRDGWRPFHDDRQIIVIAPDRRSTYEYYDARVDLAGRQVTAGRAQLLDVDRKSRAGGVGNPPSRGIGIPYIHMLILDCEIRSGRINHALSLRVARPRCGEAWFPATKVENHSDCVASGMPIGARFVMDLPPARVDAWARTLRARGGKPLEDFGRAVAAALQTYGFYVTDNGGRTAGFDLQHPQTWTSGNPLRRLAVSNGDVIRDLLDGLIDEGDIRLTAETGPRLIDPARRR